MEQYLDFVMENTSYLYVMEKGRDNLQKQDCRCRERRSSENDDKLKVSGGKALRYGEFCEGGRNIDSR